MDCNDYDDGGGGDDNNAVFRYIIERQESFKTGG